MYSDLTTIRRIKLSIKLSVHVSGISNGVEMNKRTSQSVVHYRVCSSISCNKIIYKELSS